MFRKKDKETFNTIEINLEKAKTESDVANIVGKTLHIDSNQEVTLDSMLYKSKTLDEHTIVAFKNPQEDSRGLVKYVSIVKSIFSDHSEAINETNLEYRDTFRVIFMVFIFYSIVGWLVENFVEIVINGWTYMPREFFRGPICPIFGIGAVILLVTLDKPLNSKVTNIYAKMATIFIESTLITSLIEYLTSFLLEYTTGTWPWKAYANQPFNFGGRIALANSLGFGLLSTIGLIFVQPKVMAKLKDMKYDNLFNIIFYITWFLFLADLIFAILIPTGVRLDVPRTSWR